MSHAWTSPELVSLGRLPMHTVPHDDRVDLEGRWRFQLQQTGVCERSFRVPAKWSGRRIVLVRRLVVAVPVEEEAGIDAAG